MDNFPSQRLNIWSYLETVLPIIICVGRKSHKFMAAQTKGCAIEWVCKLVMIKTIDLFAGIGGIRKGFDLVGDFNTVFANDNDRFCKLTYDLNFDHTRLTLADLQEIGVASGEIPEFDFLLGGFPCQPFSVAGLRQGFNDEKGRGNLIDDIARVLVEAKEIYGKPSGFLLENVKNLVDMNNGEYYSEIKSRLKNAGYHVDYRIYDSLNFGVPQSRKRVYIIGFANKKLLKEFRWPSEGKKSIRKVRDILESNVDSHHYYNGKPLYNKIKDDVINPDFVYVYRRNHVRTHNSGYSPTLVASMGQGGHNVPIIKDNKGIRKLTPLECARLQGFENLKIPIELSDVQIYKQIGNSVAVPVIFEIAKEVSRVLSNPTTKSNKINELSTSNI